MSHDHLSTRRRTLAYHVARFPPGLFTEKKMEAQLSLEFLRVVENAAIAAARTMGFGDRHKADEVAVEAMRKTMDSLQMDGTIVIGEGERDEAPMLYIGEKVGLATHAPKANFPAVDIAVDPLEGTNLCATGAANSIAVLAASERGGLLHAPDLYMEKIVVGPSCKGAVDLDAPVADNLKSIAKRLALRCLNGQILGRLVIAKPQDAERLEKMGVKDPKRVYDTTDLAPGKQMIFACTGVTDGNLLRGVRFFGDGVRLQSMILTLDDRQVRFIDTVHLEKRPDVKVRFN